MAMALDIGGSHVEYGIVCRDRLLAKDTIAVQCTSLTALLPQLEAGLHALARQSGMYPTQMVGVAVGICAIVHEDGSILATNGKYDDGVGFNFPRWCETRFGLPCKAENDTRLALIGEHFAGAAKGFDDAVLVTLGTGIGGAVVLGGKLLRSGSRKAGGLAGHLGVDWKGRACTCGNRGCAEAEASTVSLNAICREHAGYGRSVLAETMGAIDFETLFAAVDAEDAVACEVLEHCVGIWAALTVTLIHAYDPQVIVFGGGVMQRQEWILPRIREHVDRHAWAQKGSVSIVPSLLGPAAALLGALPLLQGNV